MKKENNIITDEQSFIYPATEENLKKLKNHKLKFISDDKKYLLVYIQKQLDELANYYEWMIARDLIAKSSLSDLEYETLLQDFGIKKQFEDDKYTTHFVKFDEKIEKLIYFFESTKGIISALVCNLKELSTGKAIPKFVILAANVEDKGKSIKEVTPAGYMTFNLRGSKNEK